MRVLYKWENCDYLNKEWGNRRVDSYWVKADHADLPHMLPLAQDADDLMNDIGAYTRTKAEPFYLLVAKDLSSIVSLPAEYPEGGQWNGRSPLEAIEPVEIERLEELETLDG